VNLVISLKDKVVIVVSPEALELVDLILHIPRSKRLEESRAMCSVPCRDIEALRLPGDPYLAKIFVLDVMVIISLYAFEALGDHLCDLVVPTTEVSSWAVDRYNGWREGN
jgi:hypothetical protein